MRTAHGLSWKLWTDRVYRRTLFCIGFGDCVCYDFFICKNRKVFSSWFYCSLVIWSIDVIYAVDFFTTIYKCQPRCNRQGRGFTAQVPLYPVAHDHYWVHDIDFKYYSRYPCLADIIVCKKNCSIDRV